MKFWRPCLTARAFSFFATICLCTELHRDGCRTDYWRYVTFVLHQSALDAEVESSSLGTGRRDGNFSFRRPIDLLYASDHKHPGQGAQDTEQ